MKRYSLILSAALLATCIFTHSNAQVLSLTGSKLIYETFEVSAKPRYPGGKAAMISFLKDEINYPVKARENLVEGEVWVQVTVWSNGRITPSRIIRGLGHGCDEEVIRVIHKMPLWEPGLLGENPVNTRMVVPINFRLN